MLSELVEKNFSICDKVSIEIERLRQNASLQLEHSLYSLQKKKSFSICSLNTRSLQLHFGHITNDYDQMNVDILFFEETQPNLHLENKILANDFDNIFLFHLSSRCRIVGDGYSVKAPLRWKFTGLKPRRYQTIQPCEGLVWPKPGAIPEWFWRLRFP